ncbi:MAG TPA: FAD-dependent oxidoreductase [Bryobacteraceae bacterium]|nr:FAD-dependent oxidoreductase [Bryobacteraceae bacterium]
MHENPTILVLSHLRWDFVYQRPQHLMAGLAATHRILYVEEPIRGESGTPEWKFQEPVDNVTVCRPCTPCDRDGFHPDQTMWLRELLRALVQEQALDEYVLWLYTPLAVPAVAELRPALTIYDCMDELSAFLGAPPEIIEREEELLSRADLVFTGGPSLYRSKRNRHPQVRCFPSSVDAKHFASAGGNLPEAPDQAPVSHPRLGYYGVIDERMDVALLGAVADAHPEWQIAMVGPIVKIDSASLPQRPNLHYFGMKKYEELPSYLAGWDVCLMPFARNRSTEFISPTKTLEYMAAGKMIVSTPIRDVVEPYGDLVFAGETPAEFIAACERALSMDAAERERLQEGMRQALGRTSWNATVAAMLEEIERGMERKRRSAGPTKQSSNVVIGAGPTGLSAAWHLGPDSLLLEQNSRVGGWCRSIEVNGFTFDYAGHIMFSGDPYVHQLYRMLLKDNIHWQDREAWIYSKKVYTRYPFQASLYGLPANVIAECIVGAVEARYGSLKPAKDGAKSNGTANGHANGKPNGHTVACTVKDCCADGILEASTSLSGKSPTRHISAEPRNFEEFIYKVWGAGIAKHFAIPYNRKLWAVPLDEMETSWLGGRVPLPDLKEMIEGALSPAPKPMGPNARFGYPLRGGFQSLMDAWVPHLRGQLRTNARVAEISPERHSLTLEDGSRIRYEHLISTMPLPVLIGQMGREAPVNIQAAAERLRHVSVRCVHLGLGRESLTEKHWIYYPEDTVFHRIFVQGNASPFCNPPGGFGLTCEITYSPGKPLPCEGDELVKLCIEDCQRVGMITRDDPILATAQCDLPYAYVVYDHHRAAAVQEARAWLERHDIILAGRYSEWEYYNSDHAFLAGKKAADQVKRLREEPFPAQTPEFTAAANLEFRP